MTRTRQLVNLSKLSRIARFAPLLSEKGCTIGQVQGSVGVVVQRCFSNAWAFSRGTKSIREEGGMVTILLSTGTNRTACPPPRVRAPPRPAGCGTQLGRARQEWA